MPCSRNTAHCPIRNGKDRPVCCIDGLKNVLFYTGELFEKNNITYWIDYGTLLGAVRNNEIIPWDTDIDLGVPASEVSKILALKDQILLDGYNFRVHDTKTHGLHLIFIFYSPQNLLSLEMSIWDENNGMLDRRWYGAEERAIGKKFDKSFISPFSEISLYGRKFKCPNNIDKFLIHRYGENYLTPKRI